MCFCMKNVDLYTIFIVFRSVRVDFSFKKCKDAAWYLCMGQGVHEEIFPHLSGHPPPECERT